MAEHIIPTRLVWVSLKAKRNTECRYHLSQGCSAKESQIPTFEPAAKAVGLTVCSHCERRNDQASRARVLCVECRTSEATLSVMTAPLEPRLSGHWNPMCSACVELYKGENKAAEALIYPIVNEVRIGVVKPAEVTAIYARERTDARVG